MCAEDHARDVGQDEEEGGHQPRQDQPAGVLSRAVHQHHAAAGGQDTNEGYPKVRNHGEGPY